MKGATFSSDSEVRWNAILEAAKDLKIEIRPELTVQIDINDAGDAARAALLPVIAAARLIGRQALTGLALAIQAVKTNRRVRFFSVVDLVNRLE